MTPLSTATAGLGGGPGRTHGLGNDEIAERLVVILATAKTHVSRAMVKLHAHDRAKLVVFAYETGLVRPRTDTGTPTSRPLAVA